MKRIPTIFLQAVVVLIGVGALALMLWEPHLEGRNINATPFEVYFNDPFLAYAYAASIAFFAGLLQAYKLLGYIGQDKLFSPAAAKALRAIKYCALALAGLVAAPLAYLFVVRPGDDIAGGVAVGLFLIFASAVVAAMASTCQRVVQEPQA